MDPATAFGLASGVVQFICFAASLTKGVIEIRQSGSLKVVQQLSDVTDSLQRWNEILKSGAKEGHIDATLAASLEGCSEVASKMARSLEKVQGNPKNHGGLNNVKLFVKSAWKASEREELQSRLNDYRLEICTYLVVLLL
jgi:hypothetical protein